jgi:predicted DNA-binding antitoxin AbrB/MazE fold protein
MALHVEATYENGVLKLDAPLPLQEHARVIVEVKPKESRIRESARRLRFNADPETIRKIAEDDDLLDSE